MHAGQDSSSRPDKPPADFAQLARRISSRTTDLLAIGIVLVASLTTGRQVIVWWHAAPPDPDASAEAAPQPIADESIAPVLLEFGDQPLVLTRQTIPGDRQAAVDALVRYCTNAARSAAGPWRDLDSAEEGILARTAQLAPLDGEAGTWEVHRIEDRFSLVAGVRHFPTGPRETDPRRRRLVCWGLAMPAGNGAWNAYVFQGPGSAAATNAAVLQVPLPPGAARTLSVRDERGGGMVGFSGPGPASGWLKFYDEWFAARGWSAAAGWTTGDAAWSARFRPDQEGTSGHVEVQLAAAGAGELAGLLQIVP